ncbi:MAG: DUF411 domain-containing protein [Gammaproteobacteria bacterium]|nr:DUF411 domain-containing protein [Gammaproteobacteria bacterium]MDH3537880.1 DUF411 domain-containing protein [Gammaproteobacteria bacterium]
MSYFRVTGLIILLSFSSAWAANPAWLEGRTDDRYEITVYRSATCGCCKGWIEHLQAHNFSVADVSVDDVNKFKLQFDVPTQAASCHTAVVNGVVIEGHVPAQDIKRVLAEQSDIRLLTVPGMPSGTPGMDTPGAPQQDFNVYSIDRENNAKIYRAYRDY